MATDQCGSHHNDSVNVKLNRANVKVKEIKGVPPKCETDQSRWHTPIWLGPGTKFKASAKILGLIPKEAT